MFRSKVWLLTALATFLVAGPVLAYWPVFFGVPAVFGQECPRSPQTTRVMPYADPAPTRCATEGDCETTRTTRSELLADCLSTWRKLWEQGRYREAYELAKCAVQAAPDNVYAQHAFTVSQLVNETGRPNAFRALAAEHYADWQTGILYAPVSPRRDMTPNLTAPVKTASFNIECDIQCPLTSFLSSVFGSGKPTAKAGCEGCPLASGCCEKNAERTVASRDPVERMIERKLETPMSFYWKDAQLGDVIFDLKMLTGINVVPDTRALRQAGVSLNVPMSLNVENVKLKSALKMLLASCKLDYVIKDQVLQITTAQSASECCRQAEGQSGCCSERMVRGQHGPSVIYIVRETMPTMVPLPPPACDLPLPPPHFAPPPPLAITEEGQQFLPLPVRTAPLQVIRPTLYDPAEQCDAVCPIMPPLAAGMQITQQGRRVELNSPNYHVECDRIHSGPNGQVILEGNVTLISRRHGQVMSINAERVMLNMKTDEFVAEQARGIESSRVRIAPVGYTTPCEPIQERSESPQAEAHRIMLIERALQQSLPDFPSFRINRRP